MYPVKLEISEDTGSSIKNTKEMLRAIPNKGIGYGAVIGCDRQNLPAIGFNYLGQISHDIIDANWGVSEEECGIGISNKNVAHNLLNIGGALINGGLKFEFAGCLEKRYIKLLARAYEKAIKCLVIHCVDKKNSEYTISDFSEVKSESDLLKLPLILNENQTGWFPMTEIQKVYLLGRLGNYEIGNVSNHVYHEYYYKNLDVCGLENLINNLVEKYSVLRTVYSSEKLQQRFLSIDETPRYSIRINDYR
jgi:non-ribosomal peptide synthase protein (TIGR01720 family)